MNIKIKAKEVTCLIKDYEQVYVALKKQFGEGREQLFSERIAGHEYLQWQLPGEGWKSLDAGDPLMVNEVRRELARRRNAVKSFFKNPKAADNVLFVPGDKFVFYKPDERGGLLIRLTAWGYRYPEIVRINAPKAEAPQQQLNSTVAVQVVENGKGVPGKTINVAGYIRETDEFGLYRVENQLPVGYEFDVTVDKQTKHVKTHYGENIISFYIETEKTDTSPAHSSTDRRDESANFYPAETNTDKAEEPIVHAPDEVPEVTSNPLNATPSEQTAEEKPEDINTQTLEPAPQETPIQSSDPPSPEQTTQPPVQNPVQEPVQPTTQIPEQTPGPAPEAPQNETPGPIPETPQNENPEPATNPEPERQPHVEEVGVGSGGNFQALKIILLILALLALTVGTYLFGGSLIGL